MLRNGFSTEKSFDFHGKQKELKARFQAENRLLEGLNDAQHNAISEYTEYCRRRAEIETEYFRSLRRLHSRCTEKRNDSKTSRNWLSERGFPSLQEAWEGNMDRLKADIKAHERLTQEYNQIIIPRLQQSDEFLNRMCRRSGEVDQNAQAELDKQMKILEKTLKYYIQSRHDQRSAKTKLSGIESENGRSSRSVHNRKREDRLSRRRQKYTEKDKAFQQMKNDFVLQLKATEACFNTYYESRLPEVVESCALGFHAIVRHAQKATIQSEKNVLQERLSRCNASLKRLENVNSTADLKHLKNLVPDMFKEFSLEFTELDHNVDINEDSYKVLATQSEQIQGRLHGVNEEFQTSRKRADRAKADLMNNLPNLTEVIPPGSEETRQRAELENEFFENLGKLSELELQNSKMSAKSEHLTKSFENAGPIAARLRAKEKRSKEANSNLRKSRYILPSDILLFGGRLVEQVQLSGQAVPRIVSSCVRCITRHGLYHQGIFRVNGVQAEVARLQEAYSSGEDPLAECKDTLFYDINSVAGVLKMYLRKLETKLIPDDVFEEFNDAAAIKDEERRAEKVKTILKAIPDSILIVMRYIFQFLHHLTMNSDENMMDAYNLAVCFGPSVIDIPNHANPVMCQANINNVIKTMIECAEDIFPEHLEGPSYERHVDTIVNDSEDNMSSVADSASNPGSPQLNHQTSSNSSKSSQIEMTSLDSPTSEVNTFPYHAGKGQIMRSSIQAAESGDFIGEAIAAYDYKARSHKELGLQKGCRVFLKRKMSPDWWRGQVNGVEGLVPHIYLTFPESSPNSTLSGKSQSSLNRHRFGDRSLRQDPRLQKHHQVNYTRHKEI